MQPLLQLFADFEPELATEPRQLHSDYVKGVLNLPLDCSESIAPYVPASRPSIMAAIQLARLGAEKDEILCDLGCGNGKILAIAREIVGEHLSCIGVELDSSLHNHVVINYPFIKAIKGNMFDVDLAELGVTCLILYLLPAGLEKLKGLLGDWLTSDSKRIVTIGYQIAGWTSAEIVYAEQIDEQNYNGGKEVFTGGSSSSRQSIYLYNLASITKD